LKGFEGAGTGTQAGPDGLGGDEFEPQFGPVGGVPFGDVGPAWYGGGVQVGDAAVSKGGSDFGADGGAPFGAGGVKGWKDIGCGAKADGNGAVGAGDGGEGVGPGGGAGGACRVN
jgi:hypothetical protein